MSEDEIIICPHCGGKNKQVHAEDAQGIRACGHCQQPLSESPLHMGTPEEEIPVTKEVIPSSEQPDPSAYVMSPVKFKLIKILLWACGVLLLLNVFKELFG